MLDRQIRQTKRIEITDQNTESNSLHGVKKMTENKRKSSTVEALKNQLQIAPNTSNVCHNSNLKYIEATACLEAAANIENSDSNARNVSKVKGSIKEKEVGQMIVDDGEESSKSNCNQSPCDHLKRSVSSQRSRTRSRSSSSFDDTDTTLSSSTSTSSDESDQSFKKIKRKRKSSIAMKKKSKKIKSYFCIPSSKVGLVLGKGQETIQNIIYESETHCYLSNQEPVDGKESRIIIRGIRPSVRKAKAMIMQALYAPYEGQYTDYMTIPAKKCGMIIGKGGEIIRRIIETSSARCDIDMNLWNRGRDKYVIIRGTGEAVDIAKNMILSILEEDRIGSVEDYILVPTRKLGMIMGTKGETIKCISREARVICELDRKDFSDSRERRLYIKGNKNSVNKAKQLIFEMMYAPKEGEYTDFISVPMDKCGLLIGRKGETIKEINEESGAVCEIDANGSSDVDEKNVIIQGSVEAIDHAKELIKDKLDLLYPHEKLLSVEERCKSIITGSKRPKSEEFGTKSDFFKSNTLETRHNTDRNDPGYKYSTDKKACVKEEPYDYFSSMLKSATIQYRKEWAEYYRSMGMIAEANLIEPSS